MDYRKLSVETWKSLDSSGTIMSGYTSIWLSNEENQQSDLHIFIDEEGNFHFAIQVNTIQKTDLYDPEVNGLEVDLVRFRIGGNCEEQFVDIRCSLSGFLEEFTEVVKEIAKSILSSSGSKSDALNRVLRKWKSFWTVYNKNLLSLEGQIGLLCELLVLDQLCMIKSDKALDSWKGPQGGIHDFCFSDWDIEVKGTLKPGPTHKINGINQLEPINGNKLLLISFELEVSNSEDSFSLPGIIERLVSITLTDRPDMIIRLYDLLGMVGYNPIHEEEYLINRFKILKSRRFFVGESFPSLNRNMLNESVYSRVSDVTYSLYLGDLESANLEDTQWGEYFY